MSLLASDTKACPSCGAKKGEIQQSHCDMERCPFCGKPMLQDECVVDPPFWEINYHGKSRTQPVTDDKQARDLLDQALTDANSRARLGEYM